MKKLMTRMLTLILLLLCVAPARVQAYETLQEPIDGCTVRIQHVGGKFLDIPNHSTENGTQLQLWDKVSTGANQLFRMERAGAGWRLVPFGTDKLVEVRNSSHSNGAEVAIWDRHDYACARWRVRDNGDGTVSLQNMESDLYLNVMYGQSQNGQPLIQYEDDGTNAMRFRLLGCTAEDIYYARYDVDQRAFRDRFCHEELEGRVTCRPEYIRNRGGKSYYPSDGTSAVTRVEYFSAAATGNDPGRMKFLGWEKPGQPCMVVYRTRFRYSWDGGILNITDEGTWDVYPWDNKDLPLPAKITQGDFVYTFD